MPHFRREFPIFDDSDTIGQKVEKIIEYQRQLDEQLGFLMGNLNGTNLNGANLSIAVKNGNGQQEYGSMGVVEGGVGFRSGSYALRVSAAGIQISDDGGKSWRAVEGVKEE